jgi:hypothetical protein
VSISVFAQQKPQTIFSANYQASLNNAKAQKLSTNIYCTDVDSVEKILAYNKISILKRNKQNKLITAVVSTDLVRQLVNANLVEFIDEAAKATTEIYTIGFEKRMNGLGTLLNLYPNLNAANIVVGVKEKNVDAFDFDIFKRVLPSPIEASERDDHATSMATLIGGAGNNAISNKSIANAATFFPSSFSNLFADADNILTQNNVTVQNHSYGTVIQNFYGPEARSYDEQSYRNNNLVHVFSAGNFGNTAATNGNYSNLIGFANISGNFKQAKNIITVAALDTSEKVTNFSSKGPLFDGRVAPQISALGANGTSDAAALVSGSAAILQQAYKNIFGSLPTASLVKALLFTGCSKNNIPLLSYQYGYGKLDAVNSVQLLHNNQFFIGSVAQNEQQNFNINIPTNCKRLTVTLNYTDSTAALNTNKTITNNLDLKVTQANNSFLPLLLSKAANIDSLKKIPITGLDSLNTTEQIVIENPTAGAHTIVVRGTNILTTQRQAFAVAYKLDSLNKFNFTYPLSSDDINIDEDSTTYIQWKTNNNSTAQLFVQLNNNAWQLIENNVSLANEKFRWALPNFSGNIQFKAVTSFGEFLSPKIVLQKILAATVLFNCPDSAVLAWPRYTFAQSYKVFRLIDSAYLQAFATTTDTSFLINKQTNSSNYFAVLPILNNGLTATRSGLLNIASQGVGCFYKQLLAQNFGNKGLLTLQLSTTQGLQNIVFEKITDGTIIALQTITLNITDEINFTDANLLKGLNRYRAKVTLTNGRVIYTNEATLLATGQDKILLYPTLVNAGQPLQYVQKETSNANYELVFYTIDGKLALVEKIGLNGTIKTNKLPDGLLIYVLRENGTKIDFGKIIIRK